MPINLQVIGYSYEDETVLGIMKTLETSLGLTMEVPHYLVTCVRDSKEVEQIVERMSVKQGGATPTSQKMKERFSITPSKMSGEHHASRESTRGL